MKILTVGDVHGMDSWKRISPGNYDLIVFVGDYVDSFTVSDELMMKNFQEIIVFKKAWPDKVVLLLGNHDIGYIYPCFTCSGYRYTIENEVRALYMEHAHLFRVAFQWENYLWTHAGIHQGYYEKHILPKVLESDQNLADTLQRLFNERYEPLFEVGYERGGMRNDIGGPFWIDRHALMKNPLQGYDQIVGHTPVKTIKHFLSNPWDGNTLVTFCDCIERGDGMFFEMEVE